MRVFVELWSFSTSHLLNSGTKDIQWMSCTSDGCLLSQAGLPGSSILTNKRAQGSFVNTECDFPFRFLWETVHVISNYTRQDSQKGGEKGNDYLKEVYERRSK